MTTICITGCHGTGKSTLVEKLKDYYTSVGKSVFVVEEVARSCPYKLGTIQAQRWIWYAHRKMETKAMAIGRDVTLIDRSVLDNLCYFRDILNQTPSRHDEELFKFFYASGKLHMLEYDFVIRLPLNEEYITNDFGDTLRPKDLGYARRIDSIFDEIVAPYVNATINELPFR